MRFRELKLTGAFLIAPEPAVDARGFFARTWCRREFEEHGIGCDWVQSSVSFNRRRGTLRGLHYQATPWAEAKLVRCTGGAIFDVIVDLRAASTTYGEWQAFELSAENRHALFVPEGFAHGFQTLTDDAEVSYQISRDHHPEAARGLRWDDPSLAIAWPECEERILSDADRFRTAVLEPVGAGAPRHE
jgi:dTDP-4-dehydrorhamnose 3,5-epimerase